MKSCKATIRRAIDEVKVMDVHCHLRRDKPAADDLADLVLYHHVWIELVSSGMDVREVTMAGLPHEVADPGMPPFERVKRAVPYLGNIRNTTLGLLLRWILEDLYGLPGTITAENAGKIFEAVAARAGDAGWGRRVLRERCRIEQNLCLDTAAPMDAGMRQAAEWGGACNIVSGKMAPREVLAAMEKEGGRELRNAGDYRRLLEAKAAALPALAPTHLGLWPPPCWNDVWADERSVSATIAKAREGKPLTREEAGGFSYYGARCILEALRATSLRTIQVIAGAEVLLPHRSIVDAEGAFANALGRLAGEFEEFHFNTSTAADAHTHDVAILAKHVPNVSVAGYWWHTLYPACIRKAVETRIDMVPMNKIVAFFSDAYHAEWCYPKLKMVKQVWAEVLTERVDGGWMDLDTALALIEKSFHENPKRIYGLG